MNAESSYLWGQLRAHINRFFTRFAADCVAMTDVRFLAYDQCCNFRGNAIVIPVDLPRSSLAESFRVSFGRTQITIWGRTPLPSVGGWAALPSGVPLWYRHLSGTLMPAWNLFGNLFELLAFEEELTAGVRDTHGRFTGSMSPRLQAGLLGVPAFNEAAAVLVGGCIGLRDGVPRLNVKDFVKPPTLVLSHDCDILYGNDVWTQSARVARFLRSWTQPGKPEWTALRVIATNACSPRRFYMDSVRQMVELELRMGFSSAFYFLNGAGGRLGRRSGTRAIAEAVSHLPPNWIAGIHYNYNTHLEERRLRDQVNELKSILGCEVTAGRAHYLRFEPRQSFDLLESVGVEIDESVGYPDAIGYRCGVAGPFRPFNPRTKSARPIWEMPLIVMDRTICSQYDDPISAFSGLIRHVAQLGGAVSLLFHPGHLWNPEYPDMATTYPELLRCAAEAGFVGTNVVSLVSN